MKRKSALYPSTEGAKRLALVMHRRLTTAWDIQKEIAPFRKLKLVEEDLVLVERYYRVNWPPRTNHNHLRHDLATLINNWNGEVDRARAWCDCHPLKAPPRKIIPLPVQAEKQMSEGERSDWQAEFSKLMGRNPQI